MKVPGAAETMGKIIGWIFTVFFIVLSAELFIKLIIFIWTGEW